jgi:hypothetical protein
LTGTPGEILATGYGAEIFARLGLEPAGDNDSWFQAFEFTAGVKAGPENRLSTGDAIGDLQIDRDWRPLSLSADAEFSEDSVVFAGYGIVAPAGELADGGHSRKCKFDAQAIFTSFFVFAGKSPTGT